MYFKIEVWPQYIQRIAVVAADFYHAFLAFVEFHRGNPRRTGTEGNCTGTALYAGGFQRGNGEHSPAGSQWIGIFQSHHAVSLPLFPSINERRASTRFSER